MTQQIRRKFTPQEKVAILRQHLLEGKPVSDDCDSHGLKPSLFYRWQKEFFENGAAAFEKTDRRTAQAQQRRTVELEGRLKKKDKVIAEIMEDLINEKKKTWGALSGVWVQPDLRDRIIDFYQSHPDDGYRRVTYMMMDADIVAASPSSVYRVLSQASALRRWETKPSKKGKGFVPRFGWLTDRRSQPMRIGTSTCPL